MPASRRRFARSATLGASLAVALTVITAPLAVTTAAAYSAPVAVSSPAAATLPEVSEICSPGQTDINHADQQTLMTVLHVGAPVAQRLIAARPYLTMTDLLAVDGIGPGSLTAIVAAGHGCVTPTSSPPPATEACQTTSQTDVATATRTQLMDAFAVSGPVADRIIAGRPYAQLAHLRGDRVPGVGSRSQAAIAKNGCLTPSPVRTVNASYRYAYPAYTTTVTRDLYALTVPAGVIDSSSGAWTSITPTAPIVAAVLLPADPTADMHIWGDWAGTQPGNDKPDAVTVTLPQAPYLSELPDPQSWTPAIMHQFSDNSGGETLYPTVNPSTGQLSAPVTSLSLLSSFFAFTDVVTGAIAGIRYPAPTCDGPWRQQSGTSDYQANTQQTHVTITDSQLNLPGNRPTPFGYLVKHCVQNGDSISSGGATFAAARAVMLDNSAAVYSVNDRYNNRSALLDGFAGSAASDALFLLTNTSNALTTLAFSGRTLWTPGDRVAIDTPAGTHGETSIQLDTSASLVRMALTFAIGQGLKKLPSADLGDTASLRSALTAGAQCVKELAPSISASSLAGKLVAYAYGTFNCFRSHGVGLALYDTFQNYYRSNQSGALSDADLAAKGAQLKGIEAKLKALKYLSLVVAVSNVLDLDTVALTQSDYAADHYKPNPTVDAQGRPVQTYCLRSVGTLNPTVDAECQNTYYSKIFQTPTGGGGTTGLERGYIMQDSQQHSYLVTPDRTTYASIPTPGDYVCLAKAGYPVRYNTSPTLLGGFTQSPDPAVCPPSPPTFDVTPAVMDSVADKGISLIRTGTGKVYLYKGNGILSSVLDGQQFNCWTTGTHAYLAYDYVPDSVISDPNVGFHYHPEFVDYCIR